MLRWAGRSLTSFILLYPTGLIMRSWLRACLAFLMISPILNSLTTHHLLSALVLVGPSANDVQLSDQWGARATFIDAFHGEGNKQNSHSSQHIRHSWYSCGWITSHFTCSVQWLNPAILQPLYFTRAQFFLQLRPPHVKISCFVGVVTTDNPASYPCPCCKIPFPSLCHNATGETVFTCPLRWLLCESVYITGRNGKLGDARCSVEKRFACQMRWVGKLVTTENRGAVCCDKHEPFKYYSSFRHRQSDTLMKGKTLP